MSGQIRDAVQQSSLGRSTKKGGGDVFWRVCKRPNLPNLLYIGLSQVVYPAALQGVNFLYRASAIQTQLFGREEQGKNEFASFHREGVWMKG